MIPSCNRTTIFVDLLSYSLRRNEAAAESERWIGNFADVRRITFIRITGIYSQLAKQIVFLRCVCFVGNPHFYEFSTATVDDCEIS